MDTSQILHYDVLAKYGKANKSLYEHLHANKYELIRIKKAATKHTAGIALSDIKYKSLRDNPSDCIFGCSVDDNVKNMLLTTKAINTETIPLLANEVINVKQITSVSNVYDSHGDVHLPNMWNKTIKENKNIMFLDSHLLDFEHIIADGADLRVYTKTVSWYDLGYNVKGNTEVLIMDADVKYNRNPTMFRQYANNWVKYGSIGMNYTKVELAINSKDYKEEYAVWEKYYDTIINKAELDDVGVFWAVKEAKAIEGSAIPIPSNTYTYLESMTSVNNKSDDAAKAELLDAIKTIFNH